MFVYFRQRKKPNEWKPSWIRQELDGPVIYSEGEEVLTRCIGLEVLDFNLDDDVALVLLGL